MRLCRVRLLALIVRNLGNQHWIHCWIGTAPKPPASGNPSSNRRYVSRARSLVFVEGGCRGNRRAGRPGIAGRLPRPRRTLSSRVEEGLRHRVLLHRQCPGRTGSYPGGLPSRPSLTSTISRHRQAIQRLSRHDRPQSDSRSLAQASAAHGRSRSSVNDSERLRHS